MGGRDDVPLFDDETGEALNAAARQLVLDALEAPLPPTLKWPKRVGIC